MRLIDADALREEILNDNTYDNDTVNYYLGTVDDTETAYDVDKVVEKLETTARGEWGYPSVMEFEDVVGIVKEGGGK